MAFELTAWVGEVTEFQVAYEYSSAKSRNDLIFKKVFTKHTLIKVNFFFVRYKVESCKWIFILREFANDMVGLLSFERLHKEKSRCLQKSMFVHESVVVFVKSEFLQSLLELISKELWVAIVNNLMQEKPLLIRFQVSESHIFNQHI